MSSTQRIQLDQITIASPCSVDWNEMSGSDQVRHCGLCEKNVYNLTMMNAAEVSDLFAQRKTLPCIRFYRRKDGTIITQDNCSLFTPVQRNFPLRGYIPLMMGVLLAGCQHQQVLPQKSSAKMLNIKWDSSYSAPVTFGQASSPSDSIFDQDYSVQLSSNLLKK